MAGYQGVVVPIPVAVDGGYGTQKIPLSGLRRFRGITLENNQLEKEGGATSQNATALVVGSQGIVAQFDWWPDAATQRHIAVGGNGAVFRDAGTWTFPTTVIAAGTLTIANQPPHLIDGGFETPGRNRKLFLMTGTDAVRVGSGDFTTMSVVANPPADWTGAQQPLCGVIHQGRFWGAVGHTVYYSSLTDHEDFRSASGGGSIPIAPGVGFGIRCLKSIRGILVILKYPRGIYLLDTSNVTATNWRYDTQSNAVGTGGPYGAIEVPNDLLIVNSDLSLHLLSATNVLRDAASSDISSPKLGTWIRDNLNANRSAWAHAVWYSDKRQVWIGAAATGSVVNDRRVLVDFNRPDVGPRFTYSERDTQQSLVMRLLNGVERPYLGDDTGLVMKLDETARSKNGAGYMGQAQIDHLDLGEAEPSFTDRVKNFDFLDLETLAVGAYNLSINIYIDGVLVTPTPLTISLAGAGAVLGSFVLDVDRLAEAVTARTRTFLPWSGVRISVELFNSGIDETFQVPRMFIGARVAE